MPTETTTARCPSCDGIDTFDDGVFEEGRYFQCRACGYQWQLVDDLEDEEFTDDV